ncbi:MAG: hypothetical protein ACXVYY_01415 [Oryzihumus sp.]
MASNYGLNFGVRRADEDQAIREGRYRLPAAAGPGPNGTYQIGTAIQIDPAAAGYLKVCAADATARTGVTGLLISEDAWLRSIYGSDRIAVDQYALGQAVAGRQAYILSGPGVKVWFKNTTAVTRPDGRSIAAVTMVAALSGLVVGDQLGWNGTAWAKVDGTTVHNAFMEVVSINQASSSLEATLLK